MADDTRQLVVLAKGQPYVAIDPRNGTGDNKSAPLNAESFNSVLVDMIPGTGAGATTVTVLGAPYPGGPFLQEVDTQAVQSGVSTQRRFIVTGISSYVAVQLTQPAGWTVILTPFNAASQTSITVTGTTNQNVSQYGGVAVGPANPVDVRDATTNSALGATTDAEATGNGSLIALVKRLRTLLAGGLPAALTAGGNLKTALQEAIPAGAARIGKITVRNSADSADIDPLAESTFTTNLGATTDAEATGNGSAIAILKRIRTLFGGGLPSALSGGSLATTLTTKISGEDLTNDLLSTRKKAGWTVVSTPAVNTQATASKAAGGAGVKHVCTSITATFAAGAAAPAAVQLSVALRDGATGAGTILWQGVVSLPAVAGEFNQITLTDLWIEGTANTAMTLEFSAAGGANTIEAVTLTGVSIS